MDVAYLGGVAIHFRYSEGAPSLVFANSLGADYRIWNGVIDLLPDTYGSLRYDKRGHGLSDLGEETFTLDAHVEDLEGLIDYHALGPVVLCGVSIGGMISMGLADRRPDLVAGLVLCGTGHRISEASTWERRISIVEAEGVPGIADEVVSGWFTEAYRRDHPEALSVWRNMLVRTPPNGYARSCMAIRDSDLTEVVSGLKAPALCLVGEEDAVTPVNLMEELAGLIPDARLGVIEGAGHMPVVEKSREVATLIGGFLRELHL